MIGLLASIKGRIESAGKYVVYEGAVPGDIPPAYPYVILWGTTTNHEVTELSGVRDLSDRLGVTMVAGSYKDVLKVASKVRNLLIGFTPVSDTWVVEELRPPYDSRPIEYDRDVQVPPVGGYPFYGVDMYHLYGTPKPPEPAPEP